MSAAPQSSASPQPASAEAQRARTSPRIVDASLSFWPLACPTCNVVHLVPADLLAAWIALRTPVHCPLGHATQIGADAGATIIGQLSSALVATRMELSRLRMIRGRAAARNVVPAKAERCRAHELAVWGEEVTSLRKPAGRRFPICSHVSQNQQALVRHIMRNHRDQLGGRIAAT